MNLNSEPFYKSIYPMVSSVWVSNSLKVLFYTSIFFPLSVIASHCVKRIIPIGELCPNFLTSTHIKCTSFACQYFIFILEKYWPILTITSTNKVNLSICFYFNIKMLWFITSSKMKMYGWEYDDILTGSIIYSVV